MKTERDLFKQAYLNLRTADSIPFPDAVFDEYVRLRDSEGYKLVPWKSTMRLSPQCFLVSQEVACLARFTKP